MSNKVEELLNLFPETIRKPAGSNGNVLVDISFLSDEYYSISFFYNELDTAGIPLGDGIGITGRTIIDPDCDEIELTMTSLYVRKVMIRRDLWEKIVALANELMTTGEYIPWQLRN